MQSCSAAILRSVRYSPVRLRDDSVRFYGGKGMADRILVAHVILCQCHSKGPGSDS